MPRIAPRTREKSTIVRKKTSKPRLATVASRLFPEWTARALERTLFRPPRRVAAHWPDDLETDSEVLAVGLSRPRLGRRRLPAWVWQPTIAVDGRPETVLLVHGWAGRGSQLAGFVAPLRARGFRVVTFDALGHGDAPRTRTSLAHLADGVAEVAAWVGGVDAVIAHSLGCAATTLAIDRGLEVRRAVFLAAVDSLEALTYGYLRHVGFTTRVIERVAERSAGWLGMAWSDARTSRMAVERSLPMLAFHDRSDGSVPLLHGHRIAQAWPGADLVVTHGLGHKRILKDPAVIERTVDFVARWGRGPAGREPRAARPARLRALAI